MPVPSITLNNNELHVNDVRNKRRRVEGSPVSTSSRWEGGATFRDDVTTCDKSLEELQKAVLRKQLLYYEKQIELIECKIRQYRRDEESGDGGEGIRGEASVKRVDKREKEVMGREEEKLLERRDDGLEDEG